MEGVFTRVREIGAFSDLGRLSGLLDSVTSALRVDDSLADEDLVATAWEFRDVTRPQSLVAPSGAGEDPDGRPVTHLDGERATALWSYLREDTLAAHVGEFG